MKSALPPGEWPGILRWPIDGLCRFDVTDNDHRQLNRHRRPFSRLERATMVAAGIAIVGLLAVAASLEPDDRGLGTHQRLGLPPCTVRVVLGIRCPSCGMTTSWACLTKGRLVEALRANTAGTLLGLVAAVVGPWLLVSGVRGRWFGKPGNEWVPLVVALSVGAVALVDWGVRLMIE
jgi:hypothetical protein